MAYSTNKGNSMFILQACYRTLAIRSVTQMRDASRVDPVASSWLRRFPIPDV